MFDFTSIQEPKTLDMAMDLISNNPNLKILAGGTDVLIRMRHGSLKDAELLSLKGISELRGIDIDSEGTIIIGATTSFSEIIRSEIIKKHIPVLGLAVSSIGGPQIRNAATIGGNICNGAVSADSATTLFTLNGILNLRSKLGERSVKVQDFYAGPGKVTLNEGEILTSIHILKENYENMSGHFIKFSNRKALDIAMLGVSVLCSIEQGKFKDLRIALGVAAPTPIRCGEAEAYGRDKEITEATLKEIGKRALISSKARDSWRASKAYREHLIETLTVRAIKEALRIAGGELHE
jgi:xanthine dehydrogenase FAD-binding subunit